MLLDDGTLRREWTRYIDTGQRKGIQILDRLALPSTRRPSFVNLVERMQHMVAGGSEFGMSRDDFQIPHADWEILPEHGAIIVLEEGDLL